MNNEAEEKGTPMNPLSLLGNLGKMPELEKIGKIFKYVDLLSEIMPKFEIKPIVMNKKRYIAILFERPEVAKE